MIFIATGSTTNGRKRRKYHHDNLVQIRLSGRTDRGRTGSGNDILNLGWKGINYTKVVQNRGNHINYNNKGQIASSSQLQVMAVGRKVNHIHYGTELLATPK
eukprot:5728924-Karenia_brevis.AAC.1